MSKIASFPFYPTDFLGDINVIPMDAEQVGMYWLLCSYAWQGKPPGTLPDDEEILAQFARVSMETWRAKNGLILRCFKRKNGALLHTRLIKESKKKKDWLKKCKLGGIKSGEVRAKGSSSVVEVPIPISLSLSLSFKKLIKSAPIYGKVQESYLAELITLYPKANPEKVLEKLRAWEIDKDRQTKNPSLRLRNWFENETKYSGSGQQPDQTQDYQKKADACYSREPDETKNNPNSCRGIRGNHCRLCFKKKVKT